VAETSVYLMTYPSRIGFHVSANQAITAAALETDTPLIDLETIFEPICPTEDCPEILYPDGHLKAPGYAIVAEELLERLDGSTAR
jgi:hypothetical protein